MGSGSHPGDAQGPGNHEDSQGYSLPQEEYCKDAGEGRPQGQGQVSSGAIEHRRWLHASCLGERRRRFRISSSLGSCMLGSTKMEEFCWLRSERLPPNGSRYDECVACSSVLI